MQPLNLKPTHKLVKNYYEVLGQFGQLNIDHEMAVRSAFQTLLAGCGRQFEWTLVPEYSYQPSKLHAVRVDGALLDTFRLKPARSLRFALGAGLKASSSTIPSS